MKITIGRAPLLKALTHGNNVVEKHTTVPILSHTLLKAEDGQLVLSSTDLEMSLVETLSAEVTTPGSIALPTHMLFEIIRKLPDSAQVEIDCDAGAAQAAIRSGKIDFKVSCLSAEDFPQISREALPIQFGIPGPVLLELLEKTRFAMSTEETRYYLNGVYLHVHDGKELRAVATDGHRLAKASVGVPQGADQMPGVILSRKTVNELVKLLANGPADVKVSFSQTQAVFELESVFLSSRLVDGTFPDYEAVIPENNDRIMQVDVQEFSKAIDRVSTMAPDKDRGVRLVISEGKMVLQATSSEHGSGVEEIMVDYQGESMEIGFNARYLMDVAGQLSNDDVQFTLKDMATAALIRGKQDESAIYVIMPMRV